VVVLKFQANSSIVHTGQAHNASGWYHRINSVI